jgi:alkanesulfonate monooxygenase SsuD/methylene tetrahydromethanopterin reductase-like flavin-dependent oxidoreductase (luciferase family)
VAVERQVDRRLSDCGVAHPLRFHVLLVPNVEWRELLARSVRIEQLGFDTLALADHLVDWTNPPNVWHEAWTSLAAIAGATSTIRLTTGVTQIPLRHPAMLARQVLTLDHISNGRVEVGLGTGLTIDPSYAMGGLPNWSPGERVRRFGEYVELVAALLANEVTTYAGEFYSADGAIMNPRPVQTPRPPIMVAALGPKMIAHTVRHADIWNSLSFKPTLDEQVVETTDRIATLDRLCAEAGRDPATIERSYLMFDGDARHHGGAIRYYQSVDRFVDEVGHFTAMGITDIGVYYPMLAEQVPMFERIATDILPILRHG